MSNKPKPVSVSDVARAAGVSKMTASYALRNLPSVSKETQTRITAIAQSLGYFPDPRLVQRMVQVSGAKTKQLLPLVWLNTDTEKEAWHRHRHLQPFFEGAAKRSLELGYSLEEIWLKQPKMTSRRISKILYSRGVQGVIVTPANGAIVRHVNLDWKHFASVSFERAILVPHLHRVVPDHARNMMLVLTLLRRFGYKRIGVFLQLGAERRSLNAYSASVMFFQSRIPERERIQPMVYRTPDEIPAHSDKFRAWLRAVKPDVIVGHDNRLVEWAETEGFRVPEDVGIVHLGVEDDVADWAGIWQHKREIGAAAVELVISSIQNNQMGPPLLSRDTFIPGKWQNGWTLQVPKRS